MLTHDNLKGKKEGPHPLSRKYIFGRTLLEAQRRLFRS